MKHLNSRREVYKDEMGAKVAGQVKALSEEKRSLQIKHEKVCAEIFIQSARRPSKYPKFKGRILPPKNSTALTTRLLKRL